MKKPNKVVKKVESTGGNDRQQQGPVLSDFIGSKLTKKLAKGERKRKAVQDNGKLEEYDNIMNAHENCQLKIDIQPILANIFLHKWKDDDDIRPKKINH